MTTTITTLKCGDREVEIIATISCVFRESDIRGFAKAYNEDFEEDECDPEEVADRVMGEDFEYASMEEALLDFAGIYDPEVNEDEFAQHLVEHVVEGGRG